MLLTRLLTCLLTPLQPPALGFGPQPKPELQSPDDSSTNVKEQGCPICGETIKNASDWARHWRTIHTNVG